MAKLEKYFNGFYSEVRKYTGGIPDFIFIIARDCTEDIIGFDLCHTNKMNEGIIYWNHETGEFSFERDIFVERLNEQMQDGKMLVKYDGSESDYFDFL